MSGHQGLEKLTGSFTTVVNVISRSRDLTELRSDGRIRENVFKSVVSQGSALVALQPTNSVHPTKGAQRNGATNQHAQTSKSRQGGVRQYCTVPARKASCHVTAVITCDFGLASAQTARQRKGGAPVCHRAAAGAHDQRASHPTHRVSVCSCRQDHACVLRYARCQMEIGLSPRSSPLHSGAVPYWPVVRHMKQLQTNKVLT